MGTNKTDVREWLSKYGNELRQKRKKANLYQLQVAQIIGCSQAIISHIECGYMLPPVNIETALLDLYEEIGGGE
jgi:transcriptional regulator with XRE-family HTH domain